MISTLLTIITFILIHITLKLELISLQYLLILGLFLWGTHSLTNHFNINFDSTDNKSTHQRSNMAIYIDHETGIEYLATADGGLTLRLKK